MLNHLVDNIAHLFVTASCICLLAACTSHDLPEARSAFYQGNYKLAEKKIGTDVIDGKDSVLVLMERGTIYQAEGEYKKSSMDFIQANDILDLLEPYSISEGAESWVINDTVYSFEGAPFEQTLLHSMTALNHLALGNWPDGGVEARRIIHSLKDEERGEDYPDDAFSRYLAAFIFEMTGDWPNAKLQYQLADELLPDLQINEMGQIESDNDSLISKAKSHELICFFLLGRSPSVHQVRGEYGDSFSSPRIQIYTDGEYLGDATLLNSVYNQAMTTWNLEAPTRVAKMAARIAAKEAMAVQLEKQDEALGALARIILIGMLERPDFRRWETLPRWLAVARLSCPADLSSFEVTIEGRGSMTESTITVQQPLIQRGNVFFSFVRDLPGFNSVKSEKEIDKTQ